MLRDSKSGCNELKVLRYSSVVLRSGKLSSHGVAGLKHLSDVPDDAIHVLGVVCLLPAPTFISSSVLPVYSCQRSLHQKIHPAGVRRPGKLWNAVAERLEPLLAFALLPAHACGR